MGEYTKNLRTRASIVGKTRRGHCVICGEFDDLTADHVPPKGCIKIADVVLTSLMPNPTQKGRNPTIQGGVKFRTICGNCNNNLLGTQYDPALKEFINTFLEHIKQRNGRIALSPTFRIQYCVNRVVRALIGHILASHSTSETTERKESIGAGESLRRYFLDPTASFPKEWRLYCWPYPSRKQVIAKHLMLADFSVPSPDRNSLYGHVLKFLPLGFWFVHDQPTACNIHAYEITPAANADIDATDSILFDIRSFPDTRFPENPVGNQVVLTSDEHCSVATPR